MFIRNACRVVTTAYSDVYAIAKSVRCIGPACTGKLSKTCKVEHRIAFVSVHIKPRSTASYGEEVKAVAANRDKAARSIQQTHRSGGHGSRDHAISSDSSSQKAFRQPVQGMFIHSYTTCRPATAGPGSLLALTRSTRHSSPTEGIIIPLRKERTTQRSKSFLHTLWE